MTAISTTEKKPFKHKKLVIALCIILVFIITLVSTFFIMVKLGEKRLRESLIVGETLTETGEDMDENAIYHNGNTYYYNENLINILLIGVDKKKNSNKGIGQADALYLASVDTVSNKVKIVSISRNTVCEMDVLSVDGEAYGTEERQICLAYAYGKDDVSSSKNCVKAVSKLLYNIPINGYYTIRLNSMADIVDSVGGVKATVPPEAESTILASKVGQTVTLNGEEAIAYLQTRGDSNAPRVERHKAFIQSFIESAKVAVKKDISLPFKMANKLSREAVTDIDVSSVVYLATKALNWQMDFVNIQGEYGKKDNLEIYTVDEEKLKETVIGNFYIAK